MATVDVRDVLDRLSRGEITAEQADAELAEAEFATAQPPEQDHPSVTDAPEPAAASDASATTGVNEGVRASLSGSGHLSVIGASVDRPEVRGPASVSVSTDESGTLALRGRYSDGSEVIVPAEADLQLKVNGGAVTLTNLRGTLHGEFNVGDVSIAARFDRGASSIKANAGQVVLTLAKGSDVRVVLRAACQSNVDPAFSSARPGEWTIGRGQATLTVQGNLGEFVLREADHG